MTAQELFELLAAETWKRLYLAQKVHMRLGEEGITDYLLLGIKLAPIAGTTLVLLKDKTPKHLEALYGTDWEWWIGNNTSGWIRYAIQAKALKAKHRYAGLAQKVKKGKKQIDVLEAYAAKVGAIPVYCLYNPASVPATKMHWHCCNSSGQFDQLGCSITTTAAVQDAINTRGGRTFDFIHSQTDSIPWRCLVTCANYRGKTTHPLASNKVSKPFWYKKAPSITMRPSFENGEGPDKDFWDSTPGPRRLMITEAPEPSGRAPT